MFLFFLIIASVFAYFIYFICEGENNIEALERIEKNFSTLLNNKCYKFDIADETSLDYFEGYLKTIIYIIRPFIITDFIISVLYFLIWIALLGIASSK